KQYYSVCGTTTDTSVDLSRSRTRSLHSFLFLFNHTPTTETYTLSLHDALPISAISKSHSSTRWSASPCEVASITLHRQPSETISDRKSTRLNSSHDQISYAVFCLKKKRLKTLNGLETPILAIVPNTYALVQITR